MGLRWGEGWNNGREKSAQTKRVNREGEGSKEKSTETGDLQGLVLTANHFRG